MGVAVLFVQVMVNITISLMRNFIHPEDPAADLHARYLRMGNRYRYVHGGLCA